MMVELKKKMGKKKMEIVDIPNEDRVANFFGKVNDLFRPGQLAPRRLVHLDRVQQARELFAVLGKTVKNKKGEEKE
jgi:hypothetical protein